MLLRKSGTEPLIRVMVEGEHEAQVKNLPTVSPMRLKAYNYRS